MSPGDDSCGPGVSLLGGRSYQDTEGFEPVPDGSEKRASRPRIQTVGVAEEPEAAADVGEIEQAQRASVVRVAEGHEAVGGVRVT